MANNNGQPPPAIIAFVEIANETANGPVQVVLSPKCSTVAEHAAFLLEKIVESRGELIGLHLYGPIELAAIFKDSAALMDHDVPLEVNSTYTFHYKKSGPGNWPMDDWPNAFFETHEMDMDELAMQMAEFADIEENEQMREFANSINAPIVANLREHYQRAKMLQLIQFGNDLMPSLYVQQNQKLNDVELVGNIVYLLATSTMPEKMIGEVTLESSKPFYFRWPRIDELVFKRKTSNVPMTFNGPSSSLPLNGWTMVEYEVRNRGCLFQVEMYFYTPTDENRAVHKFVYRRVGIDNLPESDDDDDDEDEDDEDRCHIIPAFLMDREP